MTARMGARGLVALGLLTLAGCAASCPDGLTPGVATTLYFGTARSNAPDVSEAEWKGFLADTALPRLPGMTVTEAQGLYREPDGTPAQERTKVLMTAHRGSPEDTRAIAAVTAEYKRRFGQWGVGRVDQPACTNFD